MSDLREPDPRIEVWQESGSAWRWRYVLGEEEGEQLELASNTPERTYDAAVAAARLAYPDVPIREVEPDLPVPPGSSRLWQRTALMGAVTLALVAVAVRARRWWVLLAAPVIATGVATRIRRQLP